MPEINFPLGVDRTGGIAAAITDIQVAANHIVSAVGTYPGERVMRPAYGCSTMDYLFDSSDTSTTGLLEAEIRRAVAAQVPEVTLNDVTVLTAGSSDGVLRVQIAFTLARTGETAEVTTDIRTASRVGGLVYEET